MNFSLYVWSIKRFILEQSNFKQTLKNTRMTSIRSWRKTKSSFTNFLLVLLNQMVLKLPLMDNTLKSLILKRLKSHTSQKKELYRQVQGQIQIKKQNRWRVQHRSRGNLCKFKRAMCHK